MSTTVRNMTIDGKASALSEKVRTEWWDKKLDPPHWNGERYEAVVARLLGDVAEKSVGLLLLGEIAATSKAVLIVPEPEYGPHSSAGPVTLSDPHTAACAAKPSSGADVIILFTPANVKWMGGGSHMVEVLFHELVHALRDMRGEEVAKPITAAPFSSRYANLKEFLAIAVTNVYSSQQGWYLRRSHDWSKNSPPLTHKEAVGFYKDHKVLFDQLKPCPGFLRSLTKIDADFNPFREMFGV